MDDGAATPAGAFAPLRVRVFRILWGATFFSNLGSWFQTTAGAWFMLELTGSPAWVGWMSGSRTLPLLFLALPAGVVADRFSRSSVLIVTQLAMGVTSVAMAVFAWLGMMTPSLLLGLGLLMGVGMAFNAPAWQALMPDLVPRRLVPGAMALNSVSFNAARAIGPALGGLMVAAFGAAAAFGANAVSYVAVLGVLFFLVRGLDRSAHESSSTIQAIRVGVRFAAFTPAFRRLLVLGALFALGTAAIQAMIPVRADELGGGASAFGLLLGLMGVGAVVGGLFVTRFNGWLRARSVPVSVVLTGFGGVGVGLAPNVPLTGLAMAFTGAAWLLTLATLNSTVQLLSPDWVRGRASSLWLLSHAGMIPIGSILSGVIAEQIGAGSAIAVLSAATILVGFGSAFVGVQDPSAIKSPEFEREVRLHHHPDVAGGPVMVVNTWHIPEERLDRFLALMQEVRLARMSTGGERWQLYRDLSSEDTYCESFFAPSWEEHVRQHTRIDDAMAAVLAEVRALDESEEGPTARHYLGLPPEPGFRVGTGLDVDDHGTLHASDGSVPVRERNPR